MTECIKSIDRVWGRRPLLSRLLRSMRSRPLPYTSSTRLPSVNQTKKGRRLMGTFANDASEPADYWKLLGAPITPSHFIVGSRAHHCNQRSLGPKSLSFTVLPELSSWSWPQLVVDVSVVRICLTVAYPGNTTLYPWLCSR